MTTRKMLVGAGLAAAISGAVVSATPGSGTQSILLGRGRFEAFDVTRRVVAPKDPVGPPGRGMTGAMSATFGAGRPGR